MRQRMVIDQPKEYLEFYQQRLPSIAEAVSKYSKRLDFDYGYFPNHRAVSWKNKHKGLYDEIKDKHYDGIGLSENHVGTIKTFMDYYQSDRFRNEYNERFIKDELGCCSQFFDNIEGRKLDSQQREAIIKDEDNSLVIAGAGSGKTTTIVGKVKYITQRYSAKPEEILLISFTNKSASTLAERINIKGVEAKTFHKFGLDLISEIEGRKPSIFDDNKVSLELDKIFKEKINESGYLGKITQYFLGYMKPVESQFEFPDRGSYIQYMKDHNFRAYRPVDNRNDGKKTYKMEIVKSIEECMIANFLYFNNIRYEYEGRYEFDTATKDHMQYKPDFTVICEDSSESSSTSGNPASKTMRKIYIEHFGVSRDGNVPEFFAAPGETGEQAKNRYWEKIKWARDLHRKNNTVMVETFSYEREEGILFDNLKDKLQKAGVELRPRPPEEIWKIITESAENEVKVFIDLISTFITLMKSNRYSWTDLAERNSGLKNAYLKKRNTVFMEIARPFYEGYEKLLTERKEIDFSDMINKATEYISTGKYKRKLSYIIIDEFQDISIGRYHIVKAIKDSNPSCKLFCVGDDWQSIYRFSGSDIGLFRSFEKYFGCTVKSRIETTYRFHDPLISLSSRFIQKNPNQESKLLKGLPGGKETSYSIEYSENPDHDANAVRKIFDGLIDTAQAIEGKEIFILGRYGFDIKRLSNGNKVFDIRGDDSIIYKNSSGRLKAKFLTVHKSKGLEADIIIVLNCNAGKLGFPCSMSDDPVLNILLSDADQFENGEERRVFYVAMTRAREKVFFVSDASSKSKFIMEMETETGQSQVKKCPLCKTADLRKRTGTKEGKTWAFWGCTNYPYGCDYKEWLQAEPQLK